MPAPRGVSPYLDSHTKRFLELVLTCLLLPVVLLGGLLIAAVILVADGRPVLFCQQRVGRNGGRFRLCKFRTLQAGTTEDGGDAFTAESDLRARYTRTGGFLRRRRLDELPQVFAVITGTMSLVGPRPECVEIVQRYGARHAKRLWCRPGVTGLWQVLAPRNRPIHERMKYDLYYLRRASLALDLRILALTVLVLLRPGRLDGSGR